jgi:hypothetical protein
MHKKKEQTNIYSLFFVKVPKSRTVPGTGTVGIKNIDNITGGQFELGQNFPNPHFGITTIPFALKSHSEVSFGIFDLQGRKVAEVKPTTLDAGEHKMEINLNDLHLPTGTYAYEITVKNKIGTYHQCKKRHITNKLAIEPVKYFY